MKSKILLALALSLTFASVYAQSEERVLNSDPIDVDGYLAEKQVTDHELEQIRSEIRKQKGEVVLNKEKTKGFKELSKTTEKLSETTEEYLDEKKDAQKEIAEYNAKIKCLMEENPGRDCDKYVKNRKEEKEEVIQEVAVAQAAPAPIATSMSDMPMSSNLDRPFEEIKMIPVAGTTHYEGEKESLDATFNAGLRLESNINSRFSMGMAASYTKLTTEDFGGNTYGLGGLGNTGYYGNFGAQGREIDFQSMGAEFYGKFFMTNGERFRPYIGVGVGYNQASMKYTENSPYSYGSYNYGGETYKTSYATGRATIGTEIMVTRGFGLMIEGSYMKGISGGMNSQSSRNTFNNPDQRRLQDLGRDIINANALSILAGAVVVF